MSERRGSEPARLRVSLVDLSGETGVLYTPLACLGLKASVEARPALSERVDLRVHEFTQAHTCAEMVECVAALAPDVIALSCQGWNFRQFARLLSPMKQFCPDSQIVLGGNHVTHRAERLMSAHPEVDVIVNGEGERTFSELLEARLDRVPLDDVAGLSFRNSEGLVITTPERPRTRHMTELPSPYLLPDVDYGHYDVALLETNRGCPYACAFCYWGGRIGQKISRGSLERVRAEIEVIGRAGIQTVFLCDANFGIFPEDVEIANMIVESFREYGAPAEFNVNWAKNHAPRVGEILRVLQGGGIRTTINVPLQTLSTRALHLAGRSERGRAEMVAVARKLVEQGTEVFCELIYGMPGESLEDLKRHYDELYLSFPVLRIHPLWLLPNTEYEARREELGIRTLSPDPTSDYEAVVGHSGMSIADMRDGLAMLLAHSMLSLVGPARHVLRLLARIEGRSAAELVSSFEPFLARRDDDLGAGLYALFERIRKACYFERELRAQKRSLLFHSRTETYALMADFLDSCGLSPVVRPPLLQLLRFGCILLPRRDIAGPRFVSAEYDFPFDPIELSRILLTDKSPLSWLSTAEPATVTVRHRGGLEKLNGRNCDLTGLWNGIPTHHGLARRLVEEVSDAEFFGKGVR